MRFMSIAAAVVLTGLGTEDVQASPVGCKLEREATCMFANLAGVDGSGRDLDEGSYRAAILDRANLKGAKLRFTDLQVIRADSANLEGADMEGAHMFASLLNNANLKGANLPRVNLVQANLSGADLRGANLQGAILMAANLKGARLDEANLAGAHLGNAIWTDGRVCAEGSVGECR
ncbi:MAG: pentapeptide repeat-containing protein [Magnetospirillum sp. WYHS-4]